MLSLAAPSPPELSPCREGWRLTLDPAGDPPACEPWPETGVERCAIDAAHFPGEPGCVRIGTECPIGQWPEDLPIGTAVLFVDPNARPGGDGATRDSALTTIRAAAERASPSAIIALAKGRYEEDLELSQVVTLWGACVAETILAGFAVTGGYVEAHNLRIESDGVGIAVAGASVLVEEVVIAGASDSGWVIDQQGHGVGRNLVIRDLRPASDRSGGFGVRALDGADVELSRTVIERAIDVGIDARGSATKLHLDQVAIRETQPRVIDRRGGIGLRVLLGASATVDGLVAEDNHRDAILAADEGTRILIDNSMIRGTTQAPGELGPGFGAMAISGAYLDLSRTTVERNQGEGVRAADEGSFARLHNVIIRDTTHAGAGNSGAAVLVWLGATAAIQRTAILRNSGDGVAIVGDGSQAILTDLTVLDTLENERLQHGRGMLIAERASASIARARFERNQESGIMVLDGTLDASELFIQGTKPSANSPRTTGMEVWGQAVAEVNGAIFESCGQAGIYVNGTEAHVTLARALLEKTSEHQISLASGSSIDIEDVIFRGTGSSTETEACMAIFADIDTHLSGHRILIEEARGIGAFSYGGIIELEDLIIRRTEGRTSDRWWGRALAAEGGAQVRVTRALFEENREAGASSDGDGTLLELSDVVIRSTHQRACAVDTCIGAGAGAGAFSQNDGSLIARYFTIEHNDLIGVQMVRGGTIDLHHGVVSGHAIGANIQTEPFDVDRLMDDVVFDNEVNFDARALPVPDSNGPLIGR